MTDEIVGKGNGIDRECIAELLNRRGKDILAGIDDGSFGFTGLPFQKPPLLKRIEKIEKRVSGDFLDFVTLGIGGSGLGNILLYRSLNHCYYNHLSRARRGFRPRIFILDNIDPDHIESLRDVLDPERTFFNVITKSGNTAETLGNFTFFLEKLKRDCGDDWRDHLIFTTDPSRGILREMADREGIETLEVPSDVGGRFSVLSPVGLLSAAVGGIDIGELLAGARDMYGRIRTLPPTSNPAAMMAAVNFLAYRECEKPILVLLPYSQSLKELADWFSQLWAESLGKRVDLEGNEVFTGQTPVKALGVTDQHSQIQLYIEGPRDKVILFFKVGRFGREGKLAPDIASEIGIPLIGRWSLQDLLHFEERATEFALASSGVMTQSILVPEINPYTMGQLIFLLEAVTAISGTLLNINAFDQPGVEKGKKATFALLGDRKFGEVKKQIEAFLEKKRKGWLL